MKRKVFCTVPQQLIQEPLIYTVGRMFEVIPNIRGASVTDEVALLALELEGDDAEVQKAIDYLVEKGVKVEDIAPGELA